jgi:hypothetical protein
MVGFSGKNNYTAPGNSKKVQLFEDANLPTSNEIIIAMYN